MNFIRRCLNLIRTYIKFNSLARRLARQTELYSFDYKLMGEDSRRRAKDLAEFADLIISMHGMDRTLQSLGYDEQSSKAVMIKLYNDVNTNAGNQIINGYHPAILVLSDIELLKRFLGPDKALTPREKASEVVGYILKISEKKKRAR